MSDAEATPLAELIAARGRDALVDRLRAAYAEAASTHSDIVSLDEGRIEAMVQRAADRADGLQWRRALAEVAAEELGISVTEALSNTAVIRAQELLGAPSYEESLARLIASPVPGPASDSDASAGSDPERLDDGAVVETEASGETQAVTETAIDAEALTEPEPHAASEMASEAEAYSEPDSPDESAAVTEPEFAGEPEGLTEAEAFSETGVPPEVEAEAVVELEAEAEAVPGGAAEAELPVHHELAPTVEHSVPVELGEGDVPTDEPVAPVPEPEEVALVEGDTLPPHVAEEDQLRVSAIHLGGVANLPVNEEGLDLRISSNGLDIMHESDEIIGRLLWSEIDDLEVPESRGRFRRSGRGRARLTVRTQHGDASFEVPAFASEELRARIEELLDQYGRF